MKIEEAVKHLTAIEEIGGYFPSDLKAIQLGIEALKRVKDYKEAHIGLHYEPMSGETED